MSLEGLDFILNKREVVPTVSARDLLERPDQVESDYRRHVRTYVPISRSAGDDQTSVERFEQKVIRHIQEARAPRGYLTGEYGYGKTSTALYLWQRAEEAKLLAVPPFQLTELSQLIDALYGWTRYRFETHGREWLPELDELYQRATGRSVETHAAESGGDAEYFRRLVREGQLSLQLKEADFMAYFEGVAALAERAGFAGVLLLPDEIQQYFEPKIQRGREDPIAPLFNLIQALATREKRLRLGLILVIPHKEIGLIRDARGRGDLLQRMAETSLDLTAVYDRHFATRLWTQFARVLGFQDVADDIIGPEALAALGEIAARDELSNGPRTVINAYRRAVERYRAGGQVYTPIDLVDDLLGGNIPFGGNNQIQAVARRALQDTLVKGQAERERAVRLAAAFPTDGAPRNIQKVYGLDQAFDRLIQDAIGRLVIAVGPIEHGGVTLTGLEPGRKTTEWLPAVISDMRRAYGEGMAETKERALAVFTALLRERLFSRWHVVEEHARGLTIDRQIIFEGEFPSVAARFPKRRVQVTILWEDEKRLDDATQGDVELVFRLQRYAEREKRHDVAEPLTLDEAAHRAVLPINLVYARPGGIAPQIQSKLQSVWSPYDLTPLVLMNIYALLNEKRAAGAIPRQDDQLIQTGFQPDLLDEITRDLLNQALGAPLNRAGNPLIEEVVNRLLDARYGRDYRTLMPLNTWRDSLKKYDAALDRLDSDYQRRGEAEVEGTKGEIASLFAMASTALDSFVKNFGDLIILTRDWPSQKAERTGAKGAVRFSLHPEERRILEQLRASSQTQEVTFQNRPTSVRVLNLGQVRAESLRRGYLGEEFDKVLDLLKRRGLAEAIHNRTLRELPTAQPDVAGLSGQLAGLADDLDVLLQGFGDNTRLRGWRKEITTYQQMVQQQVQSGQPDADKLHKLGRAVEAKQKDAQHFVQEQRDAQHDRLRLIAGNLGHLRPEIIHGLAQRVTGAVEYVDQIDALRTTLERQAEKTNDAMMDARADMERSRIALARDEVSLADLCAEAGRMGRHAAAADETRHKAAEIVTQFEQLAGWRRLVADGEGLLARLRETGLPAAGLEHAFNELSRDIRAAISRHPNKLDALPEFSLYEARLATLAGELHQVRGRAQAEFADRQTRYREALATVNGTTHHLAEPPFAFNFSNPADSYRLLQAWVNERLTQTVDEAQQKAERQRQEVMQVQQTPFLAELPAEERQRIDGDADAALALLSSATNHIDGLRARLSQGVVGQPNDGATFTALTEEMAKLRQNLDASGRQIRALGQWLNRVALTPQEQSAFDRLRHGETAEEDLAGWRAATHMDDDAFWRTVRGLYEKRRIRVQIGRMGQ